MGYTVADSIMGIYDGIYHWIYNGIMSWMSEWWGYGIEPSSWGSRGRSIKRFFGFDQQKVEISWCSLWCCFPKSLTICCQESGWPVRGPSREAGAARDGHWCLAMGAHMCPWEDPKSAVRSILQKMIYEWWEAKSMIPSGKLTQLWIITICLMGKSTINGHFQ